MLVKNLKTVKFKWGNLPIRVLRKNSHYQWQKSFKKEITYM